MLPWRPGNPRSPLDPFTPLQSHFPHDEPEHPSASDRSTLKERAASRNKVPLGSIIASVRNGTSGGYVQLCRMPQNNHLSIASSFVSSNKAQCIQQSICIMLSCIFARDVVSF